MSSLSIEIRYIIETLASANYPKIFKVVLEDGVESFRVSPDLSEVHINDPEALTQYYETIKEFISAKLQELPSSGLITGEALYQVAIAANCLDDVYQSTPRFSTEELEEVPAGD